MTAVPRFGILHHRGGRYRTKLQPCLGEAVPLQQQEAPGNSPGTALWADEESERSHKRSHKRRLTRSHLKLYKSLKDSSRKEDLERHE